MSARRAHERYDCELPISVKHGDRAIDLVAKNVSLGGLFCASDEMLPYGAEVEVTLRLPAMKTDMTTRMTVRWSRDGGIGLQFGSLRALEVWGLNQLFRTLQPTPET
ncbi:MAG: PilZ domain-containing protein [Myxococcales bacterium]|nr:PilZ domain-containing protein [Myxococcales bacterium]